MSDILIQPKTRIDSKILQESKSKLAEEKQVTVHFSCDAYPGLALRIWKSTYLITEDGQRIPLAFWEGISLFPEWTKIYDYGIYRFTLIFSGLPKSCSLFSLVEEISQPGGFVVNDIKRNEEDVYHIVI